MLSDILLQMMCRNTRLAQLFPQLCPEDWGDAHWQQRHSLTSKSQLDQLLDLSEDESLALEEAEKRLAVRITPYFLSLIDPCDPCDPLRLQVIPRGGELAADEAEESDPLHEDQHMVVPGLVHRYPDRALLLGTDCCATYCRYCTRARLVSGSACQSRLRPDWDAIYTYLEQHEEIRDVLLSGGDPLMMSDKKLRCILSRLRGIKHIEFLRIGSRVPIVLPQRITPALCAMLREFAPLFISIHCNHARELTPESQAALAMLVDHGIPLGSQSVLLKGVNDDVETQRALYHRLLQCRVRPYYLYQCDLVKGSAHFRTPVAKGLEIMEKLRGFTSGYAIPQFVLDAPQGGGKIHLNPQTLIGCKDGMLELKNYLGESFYYPEK